MSRKQTKRFIISRHLPVIITAGLLAVIVWFMAYRYGGPLDDKEVSFVVLVSIGLAYGMRYLYVRMAMLWRRKKNEK